LVDWPSDWRSTPASAFTKCGHVVAHAQGCDGQESRAAKRLASEPDLQPRLR
jgi:hypothetical protein